MKNKMKLGMCSALLLSGLACGTLGTNDLVAHASSNTINMNVAQQEGSQFTDVKADHWAYDSIHWAQSKGIISGYGDGRFGPNDAVTEAQFVKMVTNYLGLKDTAGNLSKNKGSGAHWSDSHYDAMAKHGVPLNGYFDNKVRNEAMKRGTVAQALGYLLGDGTNLKDSINFLLDVGITSGQNPQYKGKDLFNYFGSKNNLTRAQVITFLYRMDNRNLNNLSSLADGTGSYKQDLNAKAKEGYSYVDTSLSGKKPTGNNGSVIKPINPTPKPVEKPNPPVEDSNAKLPISSGSSSRVDVDTVNKLANDLSSSTYKKLKDSGREVTFTDTGKVIHFDESEFLIMLKSGSYKGGVKYKKTDDPDLIVGLVKDLFGITIPTKEVFTFGKGSISKSTYTVERSGSTYTVRIGDFRLR